MEYIKREIMKKKVLLTIYLILIIAGLAIVFSYINLVAKTEKKNEQLETNFHEKYKEFNESIKPLVKIREELSDLSADIYLDDFAESYKDINEILKDYDDAISVVKTAAEEISVLKREIRTTEKSVLEKISDFKLKYEENVNNYVYDLSYLNENIELYNENIDEEKYEELKPFKTVFDTFIDYNNDGIYLGME